MTDKKRTFVSCRHTCKGQRPCICAQGHKASHICMAADCVCHSPESYGLRLDGSAGYVRADLLAGGVVRVLRVEL